MIKKLKIKFRINKTFFLIFCLFLYSLKITAQHIDFEINDGWKFVKSNLLQNNLSKLTSIQEVTLPNCVNSFDAVDPSRKYYQGKAWYIKNLVLKNPIKEGRTLLYFEGAGQVTSIYIGDSLIAKHVGGYDEFFVDLTNVVNSKYQKYNSQKQAILLKICCDNAPDKNRMPSNLSDFNLYGGLYRPVHIRYVPKISIKYTHIATSLDLGKNMAQIRMGLVLNDYEQNNNSLKIKVDVFSPSGKKIISTKIKERSFAGKKEIFNFNINNPLLWSPDSPYLYNCILSVRSKFGIDTIKINFGIRAFKIDKTGSLLLNGKKYFLKGTSRHEDYAGVGAAMSNKMIRNEMQLIKEMGANFVRLAHYQQSKTVLNLCDKLGLIVWEEIPWCRGGVGNEAFKQQGIDMLTNMIMQHYNHPSILFWGLGNEMSWTRNLKADNNAIKSYLIRLNTIAFNLDSSRLTGIRNCSSCSDVTDVYSPSIWSGWYSGSYKDYYNVCSMYHKRYKNFIHLEWGASSHAGRYIENAELEYKNILSDSLGEEHQIKKSNKVFIASESTAWSENYACDLIDWYLREQERMPWFIGSAQWAFKDFSSPLRSENPIPYVNQKGLVERDLTKKESYYVVQSYWSKNPMIHIFGKNWKIRYGNEKKNIKVYSNCDSVNLIVNNESLGWKKRDSQNYPCSGLRWQVNNKPGSYLVKAYCNVGNRYIVDSVKYKYQYKNWGDAKSLNLKMENQQNADTLVARVDVLDNNGIKCLDARNVVNFDVNCTSCTILQNYGTTTTSKKLEVYNGHAFLKIIRNDSKEINVHVFSEGLKSDSLSIIY